MGHSGEMCGVVCGCRFDKGLLVFCGYVVFWRLLDVVCQIG